MATITLSSDISLSETLKRKYNGEQLTIAEVLAQTNEVILNAPAIEANDTWSHVAARHDKLPVPAARNFNTGGNKVHGEVGQVRENITLLDMQVEVDEALVDHEPNPSQLMNNEIAMHAEGAAQKLAYYFIYGDSSEPRVPQGFVRRRSALGANGSTATNCVGLGGSGSDLTSVYFVEWSPTGLYLIYPKGAPTMGITSEKKGKQRVTDSSNNPYYAYCHQLKIEIGLCEVEPRAIQRIANIESDNATNNFIDSTEVRLLVKAMNRLPRFGQAPLTFLYVNRTTKSQLDIYALEKSNGFYTIDNITGAPLTMFRGIPVRMVEQIGDTETAAS